VTVSVVMIVRNGARFFARAIESVLDQTRPPTEIVVVDGRSIDETVAIASRYKVAVTQQPATGIADARNHGIASTRGRLIAFLDHDDYWLPTKLERQIDALERDRAAGYSVTMLNRVAASDGSAVHPALAQQLATGPVLGLTPSTLVVRRSVLGTTGPFDPAFGVGCDSDWFVRAADFGVQRAVVDEVLVEKVLHDRNASIDAAANRRELLHIMRESMRRKRQLSR
jgi:glycosyltransferase involved in cell wall biosynthesis